jgi:hypothetical protein
MAKRTTIRRRKRGRPVEEGQHFTAAWRSRAEDVIDRHRRLRLAHIADEEWRPAWGVVVDQTARRLEAWPGAMAARLATVTGEEAARRLPWTLAPAWRDAVIGLADHLEARISLIVMPRQHDLPIADQRMPSSSAAARAEWLRARTSYTSTLIAVRAGHRLRTGLREELTEAVWSFRHVLLNTWLGQVDGLAGDRARAVLEAERLCHDAVAILRSAGAAA